MIEIIDFKEEYQEYFKTLNLEWIKKYFTVEPADEYVLSDPKTAVLDKGGFIFFAKSGSEIAGTCALLKVDDKTFELAKMAVSEKFQGLGIGRMLMDKAIQKAKELKLEKLELYSNHKLDRVLNIYYTYGFKVAPLDHHATKRADIKMEISLMPVVREATIRQKMFGEMADKTIFEQVKAYAFEYADKSLERNVYPAQQALDDLQVFDEELPAFSGEPKAILANLHQYGSPATVSQIGGRYFGLVNGGIVPTALAARWLADFWDQNTPLYVTSPIVSKLETVVESWLKQLFGLPQETVAGFVSGTSMAILCGLAAARFRLLKRSGWDVNAKGLSGAPRIRVVAGKQAHGTVLKAISILGFGKDNIEWVEVDDQGRVIPERIPELDERTILVLQAGNVNTGSFDSFATIMKKANQAKAWVHIDGAFGLWAAGSEKLKHFLKGIEKANSWSVDGHKTLNTPYDCGIVLCNDGDALVSALQATGSYIVYSEKRDGMLYTPEMSRRARIIELWATMKYLGKQGIDELVFGLHERAVQFAGELKEAGFQILNDVVFNQVLVACENDEVTDKTLELIQESRECWCGGAQYNNRRVIRISVCSWATTPDDVTRSARAYERAHKEVKSKLFRL